MLLDSQNTMLTLIDVQQKLTSVMHNRENLIQNLIKLVKGFQSLGIPIIRFEQNPDKMGRTIPELDQLFSEKPIEKMSFSCCGSQEYMKKLTESNRKQVILAGIETHVCVYQTCVELIDKGYSVQIVDDAVSSRTPGNKETALAKITAYSNAEITTTEMLIFELMRTAEHPAFREILKIIK